MSNLEAVREEMRGLQGCCLHDPGFGPDDVVEVLAWMWTGDGSGGWAPAPKGGSDSASFALVKLTSGEFGVFEESEDYTGHGCQRGSSARRFPTVEEALTMGLDPGARGAARNVLAETPQQ